MSEQETPKILHTPIGDTPDDLNAPMDGTLLDDARSTKHTANELRKKGLTREADLLDKNAQEIAEAIKNSGLVNR
jgi:hypothetical protein